MHTKDRFQMTARWMCFVVLTAAVLLRLVSEPAVLSGLRKNAARVFDSESMTKVLLFLSMGSAAEIPQTADEPSPSQATLPEAEQETQEYPGLLYEPNDTTPQTQVITGEASNVEIRNRAGVEINIDELFNQPLAIDTAVDGPLVLIIHTHATEAYTIADGDTYQETSAYRTEDREYNVVRVGQEIADTLEKRGIQTIHDTTLNDEPSYDNSYARMAEVAAQYLEQYPSIQMVIDVHRDALVDTAGNQLALTAQVSGEDYAQLLLVMGTNVSGLEHPNWRENLSCAVKVQALTEEYAPGIFRTMSLRAQRYNQHLTPNSMLLEVGTAGNTLQQALRSARLFGNTLADLLEQT